MTDKPIVAYGTGYFGIPGRNGGKTHVVRNGKPICGMRPHKDAIFMFCANSIHLPYVECPRCKSRAERLIAVTP